MITQERCSVCMWAFSKSLLADDNDPSDAKCREAVTQSFVAFQNWHPWPLHTVSFSRCAEVRKFKLLSEAFFPLVTQQSLWILITKRIPPLCLQCFPPIQTNGISLHGWQCVLSSILAHRLYIKDGCRNFVMAQQIVDMRYEASAFLYSC